MAIDEGLMMGRVEVYLAGSQVEFKSQGSVKIGFRMNRHMRVRFENGDEYMMQNPLFDMECQDAVLDHGAVIVFLESEPPPLGPQADPNVSCANRSDVHFDNG